MDLKSGYPYWPVNDGLLAVYPRLEADTQCEVAVIGGGITGALVSHALTLAGLQTIVLDRRETGWGSTAASTALLQYEIDVSLVDLTQKLGREHAARAYLACREAIYKLETLAHSLDHDVGFERKKSLYLATKTRDVKTLRAELEARRSIGIRVDWLSEDDIVARFPFRRPAALLSHDGAQVDAYAFAHGLLAQSVARGLRVLDRTEVATIDAHTDGIELKTADGCIVRARHLVFATGFETRRFLEDDGAKLVSTFAIASEPIESLEMWGEDQCLIWEHAHPYLYLRTTAENRVIIGGEDIAFRNPEHRERMLPKKAEKLADRFRELFPDTNLDIAFSWAGTFGETRDGLAYIGAHPKWPCSFFALGYGGNGITYSVLAAEIIRDAIIGKRNEHADLFRFDR